MNSSQISIHPNTAARFGVRFFITFVFTFVFRKNCSKQRFRASLHSHKFLSLICFIMIFATDFRYRFSAKNQLPDLVNDLGADSALDLLGKSPIIDDFARHAQRSSSPQQKQHLASIE